MKTTTINTNHLYTNLKDAEIIKSLARFGIENLPEGLKRETLLDIYRAAVRDEMQFALKSDTKEGDLLALDIRSNLEGLKTLEAARELTEKIFDMMEDFSTGSGDASLDTIAPEKANDFLTRIRIFCWQ